MNTPAKPLAQDSVQYPVLYMLQCEHISAVIMLYFFICKTHLNFRMCGCDAAADCGVYIYIFNLIQVDIALH